MESFKSYKRIELEDNILYVRPELPDWIVPTPKADFIISNLQKNIANEEVEAAYCEKFSVSHATAHFAIDKVKKRFLPGNITAYNGRKNFRELTELTECWFHLTNKCNMACRHCMFSSNSNETGSLPFDLVLKSIDEVISLGCKIFYFTGGEPFIYPKFTEVCEYILEKENTHIVILTNAKNIKNFDLWLDKIPKDRVHFQISIDGLKENHDKLRGDGAFEHLMTSLAYLSEKNCAITLAMSVTKYNVHEMIELPKLANKFGVANIHFMWLFNKGNADSQLMPSLEDLYVQLIKSYEIACKFGVKIDNIEIFKAQVFSIPKTKFDLNNSAWQSITIAPDGSIYPSPALIGESDLVAGNICNGIENVWKNSNLLTKVREASLIDEDVISNDPLRFLTGGGDIDHSYVASGKFVGYDPYYNLYKKLVLYLISEKAECFKGLDTCGLICRMGEFLYECDEDASDISFTHSNCVLSLPGKDGYHSVKSYYKQAASDVKTDIVNPVSYAEEEMSHIPEESRVRSYGCGSPITDCNLSEGETIVDLGSGTGVECLIAAKKTGSGGKVIGIDMLESMISIAKASAKKASEKLGYDNVEFKLAYLEKLPVENELVDVVISNCVINLSVDKRQTFSEIYRILKPGGRLVVSDIVSEEDVPIAIKHNKKLRGECIGGAMRESELFGLLNDLSFENVSVVKRFMYRKVRDFPFYSITYIAYKPISNVKKILYYRGPFAGVIGNDGTYFPKGMPVIGNVSENLKIDESFFELDVAGNVTNVEQIINCSCFVAPDSNSKEVKEVVPDNIVTVGCLVCGSPLEYLEKDIEKKCFYCSKLLWANAQCSEGHFICDDCHSSNGRKVIEEICLHNQEKDLLKLFKKIRSHPSVPIHGPDHHSLVPAVILASYRNNGGKISNEDILTGINRGATIAGGSCAFAGICGAATGVGIAFSIIKNANPCKPEERQFVQSITADVLKAISEYTAARCCQRDCWIGLQKAIEFSEKYLEVALHTNEKFECDQFAKNKECIGNDCPLWPSNAIVGIKT